MKQYRNLLVLAKTAKLRTAMFEDREHLVIPVVMLVEGVIQGMNAPYPEFVPEETFAAWPEGWDGRPVVGNHPLISGQPVSANLPNVLERERFGYVFHTGIRNHTLSAEAWLDPSKVREGSIAERVLERVSKKEMVEISIGAFVDLDDEEGEWDGYKYRGRWSNLVPDHLALLAEGDVGACSNEMGCGAPRVARRVYVLNANNRFELQPTQETEPMKLDVFKKLSKLVGLAGTAEGVSDVATRRLLEDRLRAIEPGFMGVDEVRPADSLVIYSVMPEDKWLTFQRTYDLKDGGDVTLGNERVEVIVQVDYKPVTAATTVAEPKAACGCGKALTSTEPAPAPHQEEASMEKKQQRVAAIIACKRNAFTAEDEAYLMTLSDARLSALESANQDPAPTPVPSETPQPTAQPAVQPTEEQWLAGAPATLRAIIENHRQAEATERATLITGLKAAQQVYTESDLTAMPTDQLRKVSNLVAAKPQVDFSANGPRVAASENSRTVAPPPSLRVAFQK